MRRLGDKSADKAPDKAPDERRAKPLAHLHLLRTTATRCQALVPVSAVLQIKTQINDTRSTKLLLSGLEDMPT